MGIFSARKRRKQSADALHAWTAREESLKNWVQSIAEYRTQGIHVAVPQVDTGVVLARGEYAIANISGSALLENRQVVDEGGRTVITTERVVYVGRFRHCEWQLSDVAALDHDQLGFTSILTRDQTANMAFGYGVKDAHEVQMRLRFTLAINGDTVADFERDVQLEYQRHLAARPVT